MSLGDGRILDVTVIGAANDTWQTKEIADFFARVVPKAKDR